MSTEPPSLAARLEKDGPISWREAARLTARLARALDRVHAQGKAHGGIEPLTVLFVGGTVRLADPLPPASRAAAFASPAVAAGAPPDRQADFFALGRVMAAMLAGDPHAPGDAAGLPPPLAAVQRRLVAGGPAGGYGSGNDVAAALELAIAASEGLAATPAPSLPKAAPAAAVPPPAAAPARAETAPPTRAPTGAQAKPQPRHRPMALLGGLAACLVLAILLVLWLRPSGEETVSPPAAPGTAPPAAPVATTRPLPPAADPGAAGEGAGRSATLPLDAVLAALPDEPLDPPPLRPDARAGLEALMADVAGRPCSRLEVEPVAAGLRLVGSTRSADDRTALLAAVGELHDVDRVTLELGGGDLVCRLYDLLAAGTRMAVPRLADLHPPRPDYRLAAAEPLIVRVLTPAFQSHVMVDYFTADGMVVHLAKGELPRGPVEPRTELRIGDPSDGQTLTIAEPFGHEVILILASRAPLFAEPRPQIEPAEAYLDALEEALAAQAEPPEASTMAILTVPADP